MWTYIGGNRTIRTSGGALLAPMVCHQYRRTIRSEDNGQTWHASNLDNYAAIRYFKMLLRYWRSLPPYPSAER